MKIPLSRRLQSLVLLAALCLQCLLRAGVPQLMNYQGRVTSGGVNVDGAAFFKFSLVDGGVDKSVPATATAQINGDGAVREIHVTNPGSGYVTPPSVRIEGTGAGAEAEPVMDGDRVDSITVTRQGSGYSQITPTQVIISAPTPNIVFTTFWSNDGTGTSGSEPEAAVLLDVRKGLYSVMLGQQDLMQPLPSSVFSHDDVRLRVWCNPSRDSSGPYTLLTPDTRIAAVGYALMADAVKPGGITADMLASNAVGLAQLTPELRQTITGLQAWQATQLPIITSAATAGAAVDNLFTYQITASGSPTAWTAAGLPAGWSLNPANGVVFATPAAAGTFTFTVTATNNAGTSPPKTVSVTVAGPVFVDFATGSDGNAGTQAAPVKSVAQGIVIADAAAPPYRTVRVSGAAQTLGTPVALRSGVHLRGGYDRAAGWTRTAPRTPLNYAPSPAAPAAVTATHLFVPTLLDGFAISSASISTPGASSIGVRVHGCLGVVTLSNNTITAGSAGNGTTGQNGAHGVAGVNGFEAVSWRGPYYPVDASYVPQYPTKFKGTGGGPYGNTNFFGTQVSNWEGWPGGRDGNVNLIAAAGGAPANFGGTAGNGAHGTAGTGGSHGNPGTAGAALHLASGLFAASGGDGASGTTGVNGNDGGGGGAIAGNESYWGGGGGGGGKGGGGGTGGTGGPGGGGSFAVMVISSPVTVTGCTLTTGLAGNGGVGGNGGNSGLGGNGGPGFVTPAVGTSNPGNGGWGGHGGSGGPGGGGAGGNGGQSIGIIADSDASVSQSGNTFTLGNAGTGGLGGLSGSSTTIRAASGTPGLRQNILTGVTP